MTAFLDSFADIDRGYFMRTGVVDRRYNPRAGWRALRSLHGALDEIAGPLNLDVDDGTPVLRSERATAALHVGDGPVEVNLTARPHGLEQGRCVVVELDSGRRTEATWALESRHARLAASVSVQGSALVIVRA